MIQNTWGLSFKCIMLSLLFLSINITPSIAQGNTFDSLANVVEKISFYQKDKAYELVEELYQMAHNSPDSLLLIAECLNKEAKICFDQGRLAPSLIPRIEENLKKLEEKHLPVEKARLQYSLGLCNYCAGKYSDAFTIGLDVLEQFKTHNDTIYIPRAYHLLGSVCFDVNLADLSNEYYTEELKWITRKDIEYYKIQHNRFLYYSREGSPEQFLDSLRFLTESAENTMDDRPSLVTLYLSLANAYLKLDKKEEAYSYYEMCQQLMQDIDNKTLQAYLYSNIGVYMNRTKEYEKAIAYFYKAKELYARDGGLIPVYNTNSGLSTAFEGLNELDSALYYFKLNKTQISRIIRSFKAAEAYQQYITAYLEVAQSKLTIAEQNVVLKNRQMIIIAVIVIALILLALLFVQQLQRKKEREKNALAERLKIEELEKKQHEEMLETKTREITSYSLLLSAKNNIFHQILTLNEQIRKGRDVQRLSSKINDIVLKNMNVDSEWKDFKIHFDEVHPSFFEKLRTMCPDLTDENLRICAYFKIGLSTKEIAQILGIAQRSVFGSRHRLKKKLGLGEEEDLDSFIRDI